MNKIRVEHFENGITEFDTEQKFIKFVLSVFHENEDDNVADTGIKVPETVAECMDYIKTYCSNFKMVP